MNYTDKFHFPQWDETDPILRKDFNGAMDSAETGLVRAEDSFFRMAYNRFHYMRSLEAAPRQIGYFWQSFKQNGGSSTSGLTQMDGRLWMGNGAGDLNLDQFRSTITTDGAMSIANYRITFSFAPNQCGWVTGFRLSGSFQVGAQSATRQQGSVTVYNQTAGRWEWTGYGTLVLPEVGITYGPISVTGFRVPLTGGHRYTITFQILEGKGTPALTLDPQSDCLILESAHMTSAWAEAQIQGEEESQGGLLLLRTHLWGEGAKLTLRWDGESLTPNVVRQVRENGQNYDEVEFRRRSRVPAKSRLRLDIACNPGGAVELFEWGTMMI